ncbi:hypothetical protein GXM_00990 [Nostoc sphaeroides CCNUC1]|uniref:Uncharacterized protein n=1 Tax=Nostoc sphaeroides CCNUC1 TaxID=2653204 RepID=A0A5P8VT23_9NOSO|nr:hypothetical protein GXM_00990 [Nostoc sphaeroides CCNUC1]
MGGILRRESSLVEFSQSPSNPVDISIKTATEKFWMPNCQKHST